MERIYYIYSLINPLDNKVFYIGVTANPTKRFKDHLSHLTDKAKENKNKVQIIKAILNNGDKPLFKVLQCVYGIKLDAEKIESKFILEAKNNGEELCNLTTVFNRSSDNGKKIPITSHKDNVCTLWQGVRECAKGLNMHHSNITNVLSGKRKQSNGYTFNYVKQWQHP
jgi:hypothetical protein